MTPSVSDPENKRSRLEDRSVTLALVIATGLALMRVIRGGLRLDPIDGDFSLAMIFLLVGGWVLVSQARQRAARFRLQHRHSR